MYIVVWRHRDDPGLASSLVNRLVVNQDKVNEAPPDMPHAAFLRTHQFAGAAFGSPCEVHGPLLDLHEAPVRSNITHQWTALP